MFPSWSGAGWNGAVSFIETLDPTSNRRSWVEKAPLSMKDNHLVFAWQGSAVIDSTVDISQPERERYGN
jgi:hypothetical protein